MKSIDVLFQRADLNRKKYLKALGEIGAVAFSKVPGCQTSLCSWNALDGYKITFYHQEGNVTVDAIDFFDRYSGCKEVSFRELLKCTK